MIAQSAPRTAVLPEDSPFLCHACGGHTCTELLDRQYRRCADPDCGLIQQAVLPVEPFGQYTRTAYDAVRASPRNASLPLRAWERFNHDMAVARIRLEQLAPYLPPPAEYPNIRGRWLDIGCGTAAFLCTARRAGYDVTGVEQDARFGTEVTAVTAVPVLEFGCLAMPACLARQTPFDFVSLFDVLEHLFDPAGTIRAAHQLLRNGGQLVIEVPDAGALSDLEAELPAWKHLRPGEHLTHWNQGALHKLLEPLGFTLVHSARPVLHKLQTVWRHSC